MKTTWILSLTLRFDHPLADSPWTRLSRSLCFATTSTRCGLIVSSLCRNVRAEFGPAYYRWRLLVGILCIECSGDPNQASYQVLQVLEGQEAKVKHIEALFALTRTSWIPIMTKESRQLADRAVLQDPALKACEAKLRGAQRAAQHLHLSFSELLPNDNSAVMMERDSSLYTKHQNIHRVIRSLLVTRLSHYAQLMLQRGFALSWNMTRNATQVLRRKEPTNDSKMRPCLQDAENEVRRTEKVNV